MHRGGDAVAKDVFVKNLEAKLNDKRFIGDISPLLRPEVNYSPHQAADLVKQKLLTHWL